MPRIGDVQVTQGEYGVGKIGYVRNEDLTDTYSGANIYVWDESDNLIIDSGSCAVSYSSPDTAITWTPSSGDLDSATPGFYRAIFELTGSGKKSYVLEFVMEVLEGPPSS